ncbi:MAG: c-type cytochrome [Verrucomicrobia subdivision 3 bacterium]|nr:c-type cytochrome [Limisphaerales bacterium]
MTKSERTPKPEFPGWTFTKFGLRHLLVIRHSSFVIPLLLLTPPLHAQSSSDPDRTTLAVEAITRLQNVDLDQNAKVREAVYKLLDKTKGTADFLKLVKHFKIKGQEENILELAIAGPATEMGVESMRMLLAGDNLPLIEKRLRGDKQSAIAVAEVLGNSGSKTSAKLLLPILRDEQSDLDLRKGALRAMAKTQEGAGAILQLATQNQLAETLKLTASAELSKVRWEHIKNEAATVLPLPESQNREPLPPLAELLKKHGDIENGKRVFNSATVACVSCHKVKGQGVEVGPDLTEIGSKLAKEALYESILDPSAGISFGFESWEIELKNGDYAYGLIANDTSDEIAIKSNAGIVTRHKKSDVKSRGQMKLSMMPAGLQQAMTAQELVDLIEYLASLKKE